MHSTRFCVTQPVRVEVYDGVVRGVQVWCCTLSNDGELVVSGSRDRTIRLWRVHDGIQEAAINTSVDVFRVLLSNDQCTIVALADRLGARKLVMLRVVRNKVTTSSGGSRVTSPLLSASSERTYEFC